MKCSEWGFFFLNNKQQLEYLLRIRKIREVMVVKDNIHLTYKYKNRNQAFKQVENLQDKIIRGDPGDGIPNIKSPDDQFMNPLRKQPSITKKFIDSAIMAKFDPTVFCLNESEQINYARNKLLVDFNSIPDEMQELIVQEYRNAVPADIFNICFIFLKMKCML